ncbi:hypothetical protein [Prosthecodimorpha hirschii]|uniref:hypothetical protein n=1 Tax=Prosthecodimorpha hirschii TaxID=665126 RepID=UPI0015E3614E|nr:hypothetical protein [Prosthecomicrobium hirschii]
MDFNVVAVEGPTYAANGGCIDTRTTASTGLTEFILRPWALFLLPERKGDTP